MRRYAQMLGFALWSSACGDNEPTTLPHVARTSGGAVVLSRDERIGVVANRNAAAVSVLTLKPERGLDDLVAHVEVIELEEGAEPWAAVVGADDDTAYVVLRRSQQVVRVDQLRTHPVLAPQRVSVGSEPTSVAISPSGKLLFVANWGDGTVTMIDTAAFVRRATLSLNDALLEQGVLGEVDSRQGLAHPQALVITDNGDQNDEDETLFVTEFFSQPMTEKNRHLTAVDSNRQGFVYAISLETGKLPAVPISPLRQTGFLDSNGADTGCFPNQLRAAALDHGRLYVTAMCTSPAGPVDRATLTDGSSSDANFKTLMHPAVFVIDVQKKEELPGQARLLDKLLEESYAEDRNDTDVRMPLLPNDLAFLGQTRTAYVLALGADSVFRLSYDDAGALIQVGAEQQRYLGGLPANGYATGLAVSQRTSPAFALVLNDGTQQLSVLDLAEDRVLEKRIPTTPGSTRSQLATAPENIGRGLFATGLSGWSYKGQAWSSCEGCHPNGASDGVVWYFTRGPRRTLSAAVTYEKGGAAGPNRRRLLLWGANTDEVHDVESIVRTVSGGAGAVLWQYVQNGEPSNDCRIVYDGKPLIGTQSGLCESPKRASVLLNGLNGSLASLVDGRGDCAPASELCDSSFNQDWNYIEAYLRSLRTPAPPSGLVPERIARGRKVFERARCGDCHGGPQWTVSSLFYSPGAEENGSAPGLPPSDPGSLPLLLGKLRRDVYRVPSDKARLNPSAAENARCAPGTLCATFRVPPKDDSAEASRALLYDGSPSPADDQLRCALRAVGTFPEHGFDGVVPLGQPPPRESRSQDAAALAQGAAGYNVPSLLGLGAGGPYFHAGNARTLEEVFDSAFFAHAASINPQFTLGPGELPQLVEFLLSLDANSEPIVPAAELDFCRAREAR